MLGPKGSLSLISVEIIEGECQTVYMNKAGQSLSRAMKTAEKEDGRGKGIKNE